MPQLWRVQAIHKHTSGLPRDNIVNTFHFTAPAASDSEAQGLIDAVAGFYTEVPTGDTTALMDSFADVVAPSGHELRAYLIDEATGVQVDGPEADPRVADTFDHPGRAQVGSHGGMPSQIAICLSYKNTSTPNVPSRRRRGRIYTGPWYPGINVEDGSTERPSVLPAFRTRLARAGKTLRDKSSVTTWVIYSRPFAGRFDYVKPNGDPMPDIPARVGQSYNVDEFWVDDAFDTVRRRAEKALNRTTLA